MTTRNGIAGFFLAAMIAGMGCRAAQADDPLARYAGTARVLLIFAPDASDLRYAAQRETLASRVSGMSERSLVVVENVGTEKDTDGLRRRFDVPARVFRALLIGKDGGVKLSTDEPIPPATLFATIDAMPMRQREMRRR